jgi:hypothetical protein
VGVTVERNMIMCDGHHGLPVELIVPDMSVRYVLPGRVRTSAHEQGWTTRRGMDYCPDHDFGAIVRAGGVRPPR